jgi:hypothetical protein
MNIISHHLPLLNYININAKSVKQKYEQNYNSHYKSEKQNKNAISSLK